jgi:hypothetical protein
MSLPNQRIGVIQIDDLDSASKRQIAQKPYGQTFYEPSYRALSTFCYQLSDHVRLLLCAGEITGGHNKP